MKPKHNPEKLLIDPARLAFRKNMIDTVFIPVKNKPLYQVSVKEKRKARLIISSRGLLHQQKKEEAYIQLLANIVESSDDAIISNSLDGIIKSWNLGSEKMFGYTALEAIGKHISLIIPPEYFIEEKRIVEQVCKNKSIDHYETVRHTKDGARVAVSLSISPLKNALGNIIGISKIARDISSRKVSEGELREANNKLAYQNSDKVKSTAELVRVNKELVFQIKEKQKWNGKLNVAQNELSHQNEEKEKRAAELVIANKALVFQNREKECRAAELVIANKELAFQNEEKEKRAAELKIANAELAYQNKEKEKRAAELTIANQELIFQNTEKEKRATALNLANIELAFQNKEKEKRANELIIAIDDLKIAEQKSNELNRELESFSYSVSHDLRAPLRAVNGYSKMLKGKYESVLDEEANRLISKIVDNANKMGRLIDDLLTFSRISRRELVKKAIPMQEMVDSVYHEAISDLGNRNIDFKVNNILPAKADNIAIRQVWLNLIGNAIKYSRHKKISHIEINSKVQGEEIVYSVKDNGAGFDMRFAVKLFGVFQRLHSEEEFEGTGVGLAIVHRIISKHGGRVWATGKVNEGAEFYFTLPKS